MNNEEINNNEIINQILDKTDEFLQIPSCINYEKPFLDYLNKKAKELNYETILKKDYLVIKPKKQNIKSKYLFSIHIDRHGLIKNNEGKIEYLANYLRKNKEIPFKKDIIYEEEKKLFKLLKNQLKNYKIFYNEKDIFFKINQNTALKFSSAPSMIFEKTAIRHVNENISSYNAETGEILNNFKTLRYDYDIDTKTVTYDIDKKLKKKDKIFTFNSNIKRFEKYFCAQIDNVISVALIFTLLENINFNEEIIFTTKEEIGQSYRCVLDYLKDKNKEKLNLIVLDTSPYENFKGKKEGFLTLRKGDENGIFDKFLLNEIKQKCNELKVPFDLKESFIGMTELGRAMYNNKKIKGITLQIPTLNYHTTYETANYSSLINYYKVIKRLI